LKNQNIFFGSGTAPWGGNPLPYSLRLVAPGHSVPRFFTINSHSGLKLNV